MKKIFLTLFTAIFFMGMAHAEGFMDELKNDFDNFTNAMFRNEQAVTQKQKNKNGYDEIRIEDEIAKIVAKRDKELEPINLQIKEKSAQLNKALVDMSLTMSQKKSKTSLLQSEINTLKAQKTNIEEKYAKQVKDMRAIY